MTTTCTNPTCSITLAPGATKCWLCGESDDCDPAEECEALDAYVAGFKAAGWRIEAEKLRGADRKFALGVLRESRRPLVEEVARLRAELADICRRHDNRHAAAYDAENDNRDLRAKLEAAQAKRVRELEAEHNRLCSILCLAPTVNVEAMAREIKGERDDSAEARMKLEVQVSRLQAEASRPCPADGMSDMELGARLRGLWYSKPGFSDKANELFGAEARALFGKGAK